MSLKAGPRGSQSRQYQSEPYLHAGCKETQCECVSGSERIESASVMNSPLAFGHE